ncbi:TonB-dependent receptor [Sphingomonas sp. UYEF23]|uniref:TonB-dependent receptor n=1 Tax=Sphingomonas sp. UYEF23 TaxID=1756408 RepID=UPI00339961C8
MKAIILGSCTVALGVALATSAQAQQAALPSKTPAAPAASPQSSDAGIGDIIVTAQRRSESLQKTALSVQVLQSGALTKAGVTNSLDLTSVVPGVQIGSAGPAPSVYVRGVGSYSSTAGQSPAVPFYTDGVYIARSQGLSSEFYDVDRVEVLKGPQGTLYGRNASGGAINVLTKSPQLGVFGGHVDLEFGNYGNQTGEAAINVPIGKTIAVRLSGQIVDKDGYTSEKYGDDKHQSGRVKMLWDPGADIKVLLNASYGHIGGRGPANVLLNRDVPGWYPWLDISSPQVRNIANALPVNGAFNPALGQFGPGTVVAPGPEQGRQDMNFYNISGQFDWTISPSATLTVMPAYRYSSIRHNTLIGGTLFSNGYGVGNLPADPETSKQTSLEVRLTGTLGALKYVAGGYYFNEDQFQLYGIRGGALQNNGVGSNFGTKSYSAFGQATLKIVDRVRLIGGLRYTSDKRSISNGVSYYVAPQILLPTDACFVALAVLGQAQCATDRYAGTKTFTDVSWKGGVEADIAGGGLVYATVSRGFKAGGFNTQSTVAKPGSGTVVGGALPFEPETLISYEAGLKTRFLDNKLQVNVEGFYWDYSNHQEPRITFTPAGALNLIYFNAGKAYSYGGAVDVIARPWRGATISFTGEYTKSKYVNFVYQVPTAFFNPASSGCKVGASVGGQTPIDCSGFQLARTPELTGSASVAQSFDLGAGKVVANADMTYAASRWLAVDFIPIERAKAYATLGLALTYRAPRDRYSVTGFVRNVTNATPYTFSITGGLFPVYSANLSSPRSYGVRMSANF